jgi:hypothetical protein
MQMQAHSQAPQILSPSDLERVSGGINPQPLPPRAAKPFQYAGTLHSVYVDGLYRGDYYIG